MLENNVLFSSLTQSGFKLKNYYLKLFSVPACWCTILSLVLWMERQADL